MLLTVMGQGITNEQHALPVGSFSIAEARKGTDGAWYTDVNINSAAIDAYYRPLVPPVVLDKVTWDQSASKLTATFKWDAATQRWTVATPAQITFKVTIAKNGVFEFAESATLAPGDIKGLSTDKLIALIKKKLVKTAEVNGNSVVNDSNFHVMLGARLTDIQNGKPGPTAIRAAHPRRPISNLPATRPPRSPARTSPRQATRAWASWAPSLPPVPPSQRWVSSPNVANTNANPSIIRQRVHSSLPIGKAAFCYFPTHKLRQVL